MGALPFDALRVKIRSDGVVSNKAVYLALGIQADGQRDVLGLWIEQTEEPKFWLKQVGACRLRLEIRDESVCHYVR
nr:transposase [Allopusillimonas ginsengisoli]